LHAIKTAERKDFFYAQETDETGATILTEHPVPLDRKYSIDSTEDEEDEDDVEVQRSETFQQPVICTEEDEHARLHLRLPVHGEDGTFRSVDAHCAVCFSEYEEGDQVVWSGSRCQHAFHYDCMLPWLVKGKKRCPICRDWFVPGERIEDQKRELAERLERESNSSTIETITTDGVSTRDGTNSSGACTLDDFEGQSPADLSTGEAKNEARLDPDLDDRSISEYSATQELSA
jgi:hypothetical protein